MKLFLLIALLFAGLSSFSQGAYVPNDENTHTNQAIIEHRPIPASNNSGGYIVQPEGQKEQQQYEEGWDAGYKAGWCYGQGEGCIEPIVPICPIPRTGESGFKAGYNRGFLNGLHAHKN